MLDLTLALNTAVEAAHAAAAVLQSFSERREELVIDQKGQNDLVSQADRLAEAACLSILRDQTPQFGIVAEETGGTAGGTATWYIDPLDGTTNFLHGIPHYAVSIGLIAHAGSMDEKDQKLEEDTPVVAVVFDPSRNEMFTATRGGGAWLNGKPIRCSTTQNFSQALLGTGLPFRDYSFIDEYMPALRDAIHQTRGIRRNGAAALDLAWVACGRFDGYWEMGLAPWDVAAGTLLVREASGIARDLRGQHPWPIGGNVISGNALIEPRLFQMLRPYLRRLA
jgi:myo-inositol-1(or 4)-monophosphatase